ncbi:MAG: hypothetical protein M3Y41_00610 [Pseudomonadota bacterium]|nr:hypothetical protein [Pseudomonadota bacterium]
MTTLATGRGDIAGSEAGPVELVAGRLYLLGKSVALDGRISWAPPDARGWQPINAYVLLEGRSVLLVDPGVYAHRATIRAQLETLVPPGRPLSIFLTRPEPDVTGNIGEIASRYPVERLYAGGGPNPFDAFESAMLIDPASRGNRIQMERMPPGYAMPLSETRGVEVLRPTIRLLATFWGYDAATRTLFTSDSFGHTVQAGPQDSRIIAEGAPDQAETAGVRAHLLAKFGWLAHARTGSILKNLAEMRGNRAIERIAPGHGLVIEGRAMVERHLDAMRTVLEELAA